MVQNHLSTSKGVYTIIQVVHTTFIKVVLTGYSVFKSSSKVARTSCSNSNYCTNFREKTSQEKEKKKEESV